MADFTFHNKVHGRACSQNVRHFNITLSKYQNTRMENN